MWPSSDAVTAHCWGLCSAKSVLRLSVLSLAVAKVAGMWMAARGSKRCTFQQIFSGDSNGGSCPTAVTVVHFIDMSCYFTAVSLVAVDVLAKYLRILETRGFSVRRLLLAAGQAGSAPSSSSKWRADQWVVGASRSFYLETSLAVKQTRALAVFLQIPIVALAVARVVAQIRRMSTGEELDTDNATSGSGDEHPLCQPEIATFACEGHVWRTLLLQISWAFVFLLMLPVLAIPSSLWSSVSEGSARRLRDVSLMRQLKLPWLILPNLSVCVVTGSMFFTVLWREDGEGLLVLRQVYTVLCIAASFYGLALLIWSRILHDACWVISQLWKRPATAIRFPWHPVWRKLKIHQAERDSVSEDVSLRALTTDSAPANAQTRHKSDVEMHSGEVASHDSQQTRREPRRTGDALHPQQLVALYCSLYLFASATEADSIGFGIMVAAEVISLLVIVFLRERPFTMEDLQATHHEAAGLGLVLDARRFAKAVRAKLNGQRPIINVPTYKATVLRMARTMAISYHWQQAQVHINDKLTVNMSDYQLRALADNIYRSGCDYVWLDCISVPQKKGKLQSTLLSRMLAVYSGAYVTLVIRTTEAQECDRYHQRCWTVQEFCCSNRLTVVTEPPSPHATAGCALTEEEGRYFDQLRAAVQEDLLHCQPYWLRDEGQLLLSAEKAQSVWALYRELAGRTHCSNQADKLRALCPMLATTPVETHSELVDLVVQIHTSAGTGEKLDETAEKRLRREPQSRPTSTLSLDLDP